MSIKIISILAKSVTMCIPTKYYGQNMWHICRREVPYRVLVGKPEGKRTDGIHRLNGKKLKWNVSRMCVGSMNVAQDRSKRQGVVNTAFRFREILGAF
jgi:hypothetical protein